MSVTTLRLDNKVEMDSDTEEEQQQMVVTNEDEYESMENDREHEEEIILRDDSEPEDDSDDDDEDIPLFANRENRDLHKKVRKLEGKIADAEDNLADEELRVRTLKEHLKSVELELKNAQLVHEAKMKELDTELHMKKLSDHELERIRKEIKSVRSQKEEMQSSLGMVQNEIFLANELLDKYKREMNYDQEELEQWTLAANQNEGDEEAFEKYMKADNAKVKALDLQIEKLTAALQEKRKLLDEEVTETQAKQLELDQTAEEFKARHKERQEIIQRWEDATEQIKQRDMDIQSAGETFATVKIKVDKLKKHLEAQYARMVELTQDAEATNSKLDANDRVLQKKRVTEISRKEQVESLRAEVELLKSEVGRASAEVQTQRQRVESQQQAIEEAERRIEVSRSRLREALDKLEEERANATTAELDADGAEELLKSREAERKEADSKIALLKDKMFAESETLNKFRREHTQISAEISGTLAQTKNLLGEIQKLDETTSRQKEHIYNAEFQIQQLERKVSRASGVRSEDEKLLLNKQIEEHREELESAKKQHDLLVSQVKKLDLELRQTRRNAADTQNRRQMLEQKIRELSLEITSIENLLIGLMKQKEEVMVNHDLLKLQLTNLQDQFRGKADAVFSLENRKFQLEASMQERKREIQVHTDTQRARLKLAEEERKKIALDVNERKLKLDKLQKKYNAIAKEAPVGEDGQVMSQAYFVIAAAQKREELQREGDTLDAKIKQATREIRALEETLRNITELNTKGRNNTHRVDPKSREAAELTRLYDEQTAAKEVCFKRKKQLERLEETMNDFHNQMEEIEEEQEGVKRGVSDLQLQLEQMSGEIAYQEAQLARLHAKLQEHLRHHRGSLGLREDEESIHEIVFKIDLNKRTRDMVLFTIGQLSQEFPEIEDSFHSQLGRFGLTIPVVPPQTPSSSQ